METRNHSSPGSLLWLPHKRQSRQDICCYAQRSPQHCGYLPPGRWKGSRLRVRKARTSWRWWQWWGMLWRCTSGRGQLSRKSPSRTQKGQAESALLQRTTSLAKAAERANNLLGQKLFGLISLKPHLKWKVFRVRIFSYRVGTSAWTTPRACGALLTSLVSIWEWDRINNHTTLHSDTF